MEKPPSNDERWRRQVERQVQRMRRAEREKETALGEAAYVSALVMAIVLPTVAGAYLGRWIDDLRPGYSVRWTVTFILIGLVVGFVNVYLLTRERR